MAELEEALDMSLAELIRRNKKPPPAPPRPAEENRTTFLRPVPENFQPYRPVRQMPDGAHFGHFNPVPQRLNDTQRFGMRAVSQQRASARHGPRPYGEAKLYVSNLDSGVTHQDIKILFSDVGPLRRYTIHYDEDGDSQGTAEVIYFRHSDALTAIQRYHKMPLDGKPINIQQVGFNSSGGNIRRGGFSGRFAGSNIGHIFGQRRGSGQRMGCGQPSGTKRERLESFSPESLEADLAKYRQNR